MTVEQTTAAHPSAFPMLEDKVALVTGAGSGIGRAGAMAMARHNSLAARVLPPRSAPLASGRSSTMTSGA